MLDFSDWIAVLALLVSTLSAYWAVSVKRLDLRVEVRKCRAELGAKVISCRSVAESNRLMLNDLFAINGMFGSSNMQAELEKLEAKLRRIDTFQRDAHGAKQLINWRAKFNLEKELSEIHDDLAEIGQLLDELSRQGASLAAELTETRSRMQAKPL
ncbi:hypothetical protein [Gimibacter soli]|uniref:Uncharacterized protein n=1 Tax=Gimibacter soli TaxID=3024400 RepID=A0AAF0BGN7_9PROT|nr:hypothetical protein [Gimibacter soli]WCL53698.1 hypothetical protein PH603_14250 [Gimibacter soli]